MRTGEKKRVETRYGKIEILKKHPFSKELGTNRLSPFFREQIIYVGQNECYESASLLLNRLLRVTTNDTQVFRQTRDMGAKASELLANTPCKVIKLEKNSRIYAQVDGSMLLTREENWKETKVGRLFFEHDVYQENEHRGWIKSSQYIAHLGDHEEFENKMSQLVDPYAKQNESLIFVTDGARWISSWISAEYPKATQILDFYHAMEHLGVFAKAHFEDNLARDYWIEENRIRFKEQGVKEVIKEIRKLEIRTKQVKQERKKLLNYFKTTLKN